MAIYDYHLEEIVFTKISHRMMVTINLRPSSIRFFVLVVQLAILLNEPSKPGLVGALGVRNYVRILFPQHDCEPELRVFQFSDKHSNHVATLLSLTIHQSYAVRSLQGYVVCTTPNVLCSSTSICVTVDAIEIMVQFVCNV